jgi:cell division protein FtsX
MSSKIEKNVMRRVHTIHILRPFVSGGAAAVLVAGLALWGIGRQVWVARVFENAPREFAALPQFYLSAFTNTDFVVQILTLLTLVSIVYLARETAKLITHTLAPVHA